MQPEATEALVRIVNEDLEQTGKADGDRWEAEMQMHNDNAALIGNAVGRAITYVGSMLRRGR